MRNRRGGPTHRNRRSLASTLLFGMGLCLGGGGGCNTDAEVRHPGTETGPCVEGSCLAGLVCLSDLCIAPDATTGDTGDTGDSANDGPMPGETTHDGPTTAAHDDTTGNDTTSTTSDTTDTGDTACECQGNHECSPGQVCVDCVCHDDPACQYEGIGQYADCLQQGDAACMNPESVCLLGGQPPSAGMCHFPCDDACDCPAPPQGYAAACSPILLDSNETVCHLDCSGGQPCPQGTVCVEDTFCLHVNFISNYGDCVNQGGVCDTNGTCVVDNVSSPSKGICGAGCQANNQCPAAATGNAAPTCLPLSNEISACVLDCSSGQACPTGTICDPQYSLCMWPVAGLPNYGPCLNETEPCELNGACINGPIDNPTHSSCSSPCQAQGQCLPPPNGDAVPTCYDFGGDAFCMLDCSSGQTCPTGMICFDDSVCLWGP